MTKAELLVDLASKSWVHHLSGAPSFKELKPDGTNWYAQNLADVFADTSVYRNVDFYVMDEGGAGEEAFYKDKIPVSVLATDNEIFVDEVRTELISMFPTQGFSIVAADYETLSGVIRTYIADDTETDKDVIVGYTFEQNPSTKALTLRKLLETSDIIMQMRG